MIETWDETTQRHTSERVDALTKMAATGLSSSVIARVLKVPHSTLRDFCRANGIKFTRRTVTTNNPMLALAQAEENRPLKPATKSRGTPNDTLDRVISALPITDIAATAKALGITESCLASAFSRGSTQGRMKSIGHHNETHYVAI